MLSTDKQTDKLTNATKNITSFAKEVIIISLNYLKLIDNHRYRINPYLCITVLIMFCFFVGFFCFVLFFGGRGGVKCKFYKLFFFFFYKTTNSPNAFHVTEKRNLLTVHNYVNDSEIYCVLLSVWMLKILKHIPWFKHSLISTENGYTFNNQTHVFNTHRLDALKNESYCCCVKKCYWLGMMGSYTGSCCIIIGSVSRHDDVVIFTYCQIQLCKTKPYGYIPRVESLILCCCKKHLDNLVHKTIWLGGKFLRVCKVDAHKPCSVSLSLFTFLSHGHGLLGSGLSKDFS